MFVLDCAARSQRWLPPCLALPATSFRPCRRGARPAIAIIVFNEITLRRSRVAETNDMALRSARLAASELDRVIEGVNGPPLAVSSAPAVRNLDAENCADYLSHLQNQVTLVTGIVAIDLQGGLRCSRNPPRPQQNYGMRPSSGRRWRAASRPWADTRWGARAAGRRCPSACRSGARTAPSWAFWRPGSISRRSASACANAGSRRAARSTIADAEGVIVFREPFPDRFLGTRIPDAFQRLVHAPSPGVETVVSQDGTTRVIGYIPATPRLPLYISAGLSSDASFEAIDRSTGVGLLIALLGVAGALLAAREFGERFVQRPIRRILDAIRAWRGGDLTARVVEPRAGRDRGGRRRVRRPHGRNRPQARGARPPHPRIYYRAKNNLAIVQALVTQTLRREGVTGRRGQARRPPGRAGQGA